MSDPIAWPDDLVPFRVAFYLQAHRGGTESPFSRVGKYYGLSAPRWIAKFTFRAEEAPDGFAPRLDSMLDDIAGVGQVTLWDFRRPGPQRMRVLGPGGSITHAAVAKGATSMTLQGFWPGSVAFSTGDYVGGDGRPHRIKSTVYADASGNAAIDFKPPLRSAIVAGTAAIVSRVRGTFRLASDGADDAGMNETEIGQPTEYTLTFVEDLNLGA